MYATLTTVLALIVLTTTSCFAAPQSISDIISNVLSNQIVELNAESSNGSVTRISTTTETTNEPGKSTTQIAFVSGASTEGGNEIAASAIGGVAEAVADDGIAATIADVGGGARVDGNKASSDGRALLGAIAIKDGSISTTTVIARTTAGSDEGSETETLGLTSSTGPDGEAFGIQQTLSTTGASDRSTTQGDQMIGSSVAAIATRVILAVGSTSVNKPKEEEEEETGFVSPIEQAKIELLSKG